MAEQKKALRWQARIEWRDGQPPLSSPEVPWRLLKSWADGVLSVQGSNVERIVITRAGAKP